MNLQELLDERLPFRLDYAPTDELLAQSQAPEIWNRAALEAAAPPDLAHCPVSYACCSVLTVYSFDVVKALAAAAKGRPASLSVLALTSFPGTFPARFDQVPDGTSVVVFPDEFKTAAANGLLDDLLGVFAAIRDVAPYADAAAHLYGAISVDDFCGLLRQKVGIEISDLRSLLPARIPVETDFAFCRDDVIFHRFFDDLDPDRPPDPDYSEEVAMVNAPAPKSGYDDEDEDSDDDFFDADLDPNATGSDGETGEDDGVTEQDLLNGLGIMTHDPRFRGPAPRMVREFLEAAAGAPRRHFPYRKEFLDWAHRDWCGKEPWTGRVAALLRKRVPGIARPRVDTVNSLLFFLAQFQSTPVFLAAKSRFIESEPHLVHALDALPDVAASCRRWALQGLTPGEASRLSSL